MGGRADGRTPKEISAHLEKSVTAIYAELNKRQDGTRLPDQCLRYSAELAQRRVQASLERLGKRAGQSADMNTTAGNGTASR